MVELVSLVHEQLYLLASLQHAVNVGDHDVFDIVDLRFHFGYVIGSGVGVKYILKTYCKIL